MGDSRRRREGDASCVSQGCRGVPRMFFTGERRNARVCIGDIVVNACEKREEPFVFAAEIFVKLHRLFC